MGMVFVLGGWTPLLTLSARCPCHNAELLYREVHNSSKPASSRF